MFVSIDIYEYITRFVDDDTVLNMFRVNKKFRQDEYIQRFMSRRYPFLLNFQENGENIFCFSRRKIYYISKLNKEYNIPYIPNQFYDPEEFYRKHKDTDYIYDYAIISICENNNMETLKTVSKMWKDYNLNYDNAILIATSLKYIDMIECFVEENLVCPNNIMPEAAESNNLDLMKFLITKGGNKFQRCLEIAAGKGNMDMVQLMLDNGVNSFNYAIQRAGINGYEDIEELLFQYQHDSFII